MCCCSIMRVTFYFVRLPFMDVVILVSLHLHKFLTCLILMTNNMKKSYYGKPMVYPNAALISEINAKSHSNVSQCFHYQQEKKN